MTLTIKNFQSHNESKLPFISPGTNYIIGPSDSGKSGIIRSLELLAQNRPDGMRYRRHNTKETSVEWKGVRRRRGSTLNQYEVDDETYKALRLAVPRQVTDRLRLNPINFRGQHVPYFLLNESPGAVAKAMNELADLGLIDHVSVTLKGQQRENEALTKAQKASRSLKEKEIESLQWAETASEELSVIEELEKKAFAAEIKARVISGLLENLKLGEEQLQVLRTVDASCLDSALVALDPSRRIRLTSCLKELDEARAWLASCPDCKTEAITASVEALDNKRLERLKKILPELKEYQEDLAACPVIVDDLARLEAVVIPTQNRLLGVLEELEVLRSRVWPSPEWEADLERVKAAFYSVMEMEGKIDSLDATLAALNQKRVELVAVTERIGTASKAFEEALAAAGVCPLCNQTCGGEH